MSEFSHEFSIVIPGQLDDVFDALTNKERLARWFAEHVDIELKPGGNFRFWGKHTLGTRTASDATQQILDLSDKSSLSFSWRLLGIDSLVRWTLKEVEGGTQLVTHHTFANKPTEVRTKEFVDDLWRLNTANLCAHVINRDVVLPDYDDPAPEVRHSVLIKAPRSKVFAALTKPEHIKQWAGGENPLVEPVKGGRYSLGWRYEMEGQMVDGGPTTIIDIVENERLSIDWPDWRGDTSVPKQTVTFLLADEDGQTRVTLIHSGFVRTVDISDYGFGWLYFLDNISKVATEEA